MTKTASSKLQPGRAPAKEVAGRAVLGTTRDGVHILKPNGRATHFTQKQLSEAVAAALASRRSG